VPHNPKLYKALKNHFPRWYFESRIRILLIHTLRNFRRRRYYTFHKS